MDIDYERKIGSGNHHRTNNTKRVCHFCDKEFSSGKALGGHMRIHFQKKANNQDDDDISNKKLLKTHHTTTTTTTTLKKKKRKNDYYDVPICAICGKDFPSWKSLYGHMRCHPGRGWKGTVPPSLSSSSSDLTASLKRWPVTAERGRKASASASASSEVSSSSVDVELLNAVDHLLMLSRGHEFENRKKRRRKKKLKLSDLEAEEEDYKYKCNICEKSFSSPQALGGHRASHNKVKHIVIIDSARRGLEFDLNEVPPCV